jgi:hypothetical protein
MLEDGSFVFWSQKEIEEKFGFKYLRHLEVRQRSLFLLSFLCIFRCISSWLFFVFVLLTP